MYHSVETAHAPLQLLKTPFHLKKTLCFNFEKDDPLQLLKRLLYFKF